MSITSDVKTLLNGSVDDKLEVIERRTNERLKAIIGVNEIPPELDHISFEVTMKRFNRIGNEGMSSYSQEGLSVVFPESDFNEYSSEINDWKKANDDSETMGRFRLY